MLISEIKDPLVRELAEDRSISSSISLTQAFSWDRSPEKWNFWNDVNNGKDQDVAAHRERDGPQIGNLAFNIGQQGQRTKTD